MVAGEELWLPEKEPIGFFQASTEQKTTDKEGESIPVVRGGFIPNSVLLRLLWPNPPPVKPPDRAYQLPTLTANQLEELDGDDKVTTLQKFVGKIN